MTYWTPFVIVAVLGVLFYILPTRTRPDLFFAVTVEPDFPTAEQGRRILRTYQLHIGIVTMLAFAALVMVETQASLRSVPWVLAVELPYVVLLNAAMVRARKQTLRFRREISPIRESSVLRPALEIPGGPGVAFGPFVLLGLLGLYAWLQWDAIPSQFPIHYGPGGPDRWLPKTPLNVMGFLLLLATMCAAYLALQSGIVHAMRRIYATGPAAESERRFKRLSLVLLQVTAYFLVIPAGIAFLVPAEDHPLLRLLPWIVGAFIAFTVLCLVLMVRWGQGGGRLNVVIDGAEELRGDGTPDECWKLGLFYFNPDDEAVVVETRFGIGQTVNWARAQTWLLMLLLMAPLLVMMILRP